jgi:hypothetical protein
MHCNRLVNFTSSNTYRFGLIVLFQLVALIGFAQTATIRGTVIDLESKPAAGTIIREKSNPSNGTAVDAFGRFSINIPDGVDIVLEFTFFGNKKKSRLFDSLPER